MQDVFNHRPGFTADAAFFFDPFKRLITDTKIPLPVGNQVFQLVIKFSKGKSFVAAPQNNRNYFIKWHRL